MCYCYISTIWVVAPSTAGKENWQGHFKIQFGNWKNTHIKQCKWNPFCVCVCVPWRLIFRLHWRCGKSCMLSHFSHVRPFATLWTVACYTSLSMGFSRQGYWSGLLFPSPGNVPNPGIKRASLMSPALARGLFTSSTTWKPQVKSLEGLKNVETMAVVLQYNEEAGLHKYNAWAMICPPDLMVY